MMAFTLFPGSQQQQQRQQGVTQYMGQFAGLTSPETAFEVLRMGQVAQFRLLRVSPNFTWGEVVLNRTDSRILSHVTLNILRTAAQLAQRMEQVRTQVGSRSINVTSWWRDAVSNTEVGGVPNSQHLTGNAIDFNVSGLTPKQVQSILDATWPGGLGYGPTFTHLDNRPQRARFSYA
jgi:Peptidase M15